MADPQSAAADETIAPPTLPAEWYHDPAIFERERSLVFARNWALVGRCDQVPQPGDYLRADLAGRPIFVIRDRNGDLKAFHNVCRHRAGPLVTQDLGHCDVLRCAYHGWLYDLQGALKKAPQFLDSEKFNRAAYNLFSVGVETWNGLIFVSLDASGPSLHEWLGDIVGIAAEFPNIEDMTFHREDQIDGRANWKTYGDNSAEGYHVGVVHKALGKAVEREEVIVRPYENGQFVGFDVTYRGDDYSGGRRGFWIYKFPGLLLHFADKSINIERVIPISANQIRLVRWFWFSEESGLSAEAKDTYAANSMEVMREDLAICEAVQRNLEAGVYDEGRLSPSAECGTIYIQRLLRQALDLENEDADHE